MITPSEAVVWRCSVKKVFLEISQNSQENTCARVSFILKERLWHKCFPVNFAKFLRTRFPFLIEYLWWLLLLTESEICSKLPIRKPKGRHWHFSGVFILNFEHFAPIALVFPLSKSWTSNCRLVNESYHINICIIHVCI